MPQAYLNFNSSPFFCKRIKDTANVSFTVSYCIWANILIETPRGVQIPVLGGALPQSGCTFCTPGGAFHLGGAFRSKGVTLFSNNGNNRCKCKNHQFEDDNLHTSRNTVLTVFLVLYRPRYRNTGRFFA